MGGETVYEGKICRACLGKKQRGETIVSHEPPPSKPVINEPFYHEPRYKPRRDIENTSEKRILIRELTRKQSKKNGYFTTFIVNLLVLQWLFPSITYLIF